MTQGWGVGAGGGGVGSQWDDVGVGVVRKAGGNVDGGGVEDEGGGGVEAGGTRSGVWSWGRSGWSGW